MRMITGPILMWFRIASLLLGLINGAEANGKRPEVDCTAALVSLHPDDEQPWLEHQNAAGVCRNPERGEAAEARMAKSRLIIPRHNLAPQLEVMG